MPTLGHLRLPLSAEACWLRHLTKSGITSSLVYKPLIKREPNVLTMLQAGKMDLVIDIPDSMDPGHVD